LFCAKSKNHGGKLLMFKIFRKVQEQPLRASSQRKKEGLKRTFTGNNNHFGIPHDLPPSFLGLM
jgi:hypothetical protein